MLQRCCQPPLDVQHHPPLVGVGLHRLDDKIMRNVVEKPDDVTVQHPRVCETTLPTCPDRVPALTASADSRRSPRGTSAPPPSPTPRPPPSPTPRPPPSAPPGPPRSAPRASASPRRAVLVSPPPAPEVENTTPRTSDSTSHTACFAARTRTPRPCTHPPQVRPGWLLPSRTLPPPPAWRSQTACLSTSVGSHDSSRPLAG